jgi:predicted SAM-dependent methyltransferase
MGSETNTIRSLVLRFITPKSNGVDLGYGGDCITPNTIAMDMPSKYASMGNDPQHLFGDARNLHWFRDNALDYVYSSHLLEDFPNTLEVLTEWVRVVKPGGHLLLCLPNEQKFRAHCAKTGQSYNSNHQCLEMSLSYMQELFTKLKLETVFTWQEHPYSFVIVGRKSTQ